MLDKPAVRRQYGEFNYAEAGASDRWSDYEDAMRSGASEFNTGKVYEDAPARGGVQSGDTGIMQTHSAGTFAPFSIKGILRATLAPSGITPGQTYLSRTDAGWPGDTPLDLQAQVQRNAPWRKSRVNGGGV